MPHLLVLDDEEIVTFAISYLAESFGWKVSSSNDPDEAIALLKTSVIDVLLTDFHMPRTTGFEVIGALRLFQSSIPVILMSAIPCEIDSVEAARLGVLAILEKPFDNDLLVATLNRAVGVISY